MAGQKRLVFSRGIEGTFQLCTISLAKSKKNEGKEKRLTFSLGNKLESAWSPCGRYIAFTYDFINKQGKQIPQIAVINIATKHVRIMTKSSYSKSFPVWTYQTLYHL